MPFADDTAPAVRWRAIYSLGRLRAPAAANVLLVALRAEDPLTRAAAARALMRTYAVAAKLAPATVAGLLTRALDDDDPGSGSTRCARWGPMPDSTLSPKVAARLDDPDANVRVQAAAALGDLGGPAAVQALGRIVSGKGTFALRREALLSLARTDSARFAARRGRGAGARDWRNRAAAAEGWGQAGAKGTSLVYRRSGRASRRGRFPGLGRGGGWARLRPLGAARRAAEPPRCGNPERRRHGCRAGRRILPILRP